MSAGHSLRSSIPDACNLTYIVESNLIPKWSRSIDFPITDPTLLFVLFA